MKTEMKNPRNRVAIGVVFAMIGIWVFVIITSYRDAKKETYGPSAQLNPIGNASRRSISWTAGNSASYSSNAPMISGNAVRRYAYQGHSSMPATSGMNGSSSMGGYRIHTTSSASYHSYGSNGGSGGGAYTSSNRKASSSQGASYGGVSVSMPTIAISSSRLTNKSSSVTPVRAAAPGRRRVHDNGAGGYDGDSDGEYYDGKWWSEDEEGWVSEPWDGVEKIEGGRVYRYDGSILDWVLVEGQADPDSPIGDMPWLLLLLMAGGYVICRKRDSIQLVFRRKVA